jgi:hypothetical protein
MDFGLPLFGGLLIPPFRNLATAKVSMMLGPVVSLWCLLCIAGSDLCLDALKEMLDSFICEDISTSHFNL